MLGLFWSRSCIPSQLHYPSRCRSGVKSCRSRSCLCGSPPRAFESFAAMFNGRPAMGSAQIKSCSTKQSKCVYWVYVKPTTRTNNRCDEATRKLYTLIVQMFIISLNLVVQVFIISSSHEPIAVFVVKLFFYCILLYACLRWLFDHLPTNGCEASAERLTLNPRDD